MLVTLQQQRTTQQQQDLISGLRLGVSRRRWWTASLTFLKVDALYLPRLCTSFSIIALISLDDLPIWLITQGGSLPPRLFLGSGGRRAVQSGTTLNLI